MQLSPAERGRPKRLTTQGKRSTRELNRARILLLLDDGWAPIDVAEAVGCSIATVRRVRRRYEEGSLDRALVDAPRPGQARQASRGRDRRYGLLGHHLKPWRKNMVRRGARQCLRPQHGGRPQPLRAPLDH